MGCMKKKIFWAILGVVIFIIYTLLIKYVDVQPIGPEGSAVGFAAVNGAFHELTGVRMGLYEITDFLSLAALAVIVVFALAGLGQWIQRKKLLKVDAEILALGIFYVVVLGVYALFELVKINYRPVLIEGVLETSYPSSTTMLAITVFASAIMLVPKYFEGWKEKIALAFLGAMLGFLVGGRLLSGVHWLTDIIGGVILSVALLAIFELILTIMQNLVRRNK